MDVLVTGGAGHVGRAVVDELLARGHAVTVVGRTADVTLEGAAYRPLDITDPAAVVRQLAGFQAVVHLAAIPYPGSHPDTQLFDINVRGTFNLFEACAVHDIRRVVVASSINAVGNKFGVRGIDVRYLPLDEAHPTLTTDSYSLSKQLTEELGRYAWDRYGIASVSLRIPAVVTPNERTLGRLRRAHLVGDTRGWDTDFWCLVDARDSARAFALGVEAEFEGAQPLFINDAWNAVGLPSRELAAARYPLVTDWREAIAADEALITCRRAKEVIGWEPAFSWRGVAAGGAVP